MRTLLALGFAALWTTLTGSASGQCAPTWVPVGRGFPSSRVDSIAAMPNGRDVVAAIGQSFSSGYTMVDVAYWDGVTWQNLQPGFFPRANRRGSVAVDDAGNILAENGGVWRWTGSSWLDITPGGPADPFGGTSMRQMPNGDIVFFREVNTGTSPNVITTFEGWWYSGGIWAQVHADTAQAGNAAEMKLLLPDGSVLVRVPSASVMQLRSGTGTVTIPVPFTQSLTLSYRPSTGRLIACGGLATWGLVVEWNGTSWQRIGTQTNRVIVGVAEDALGNLWAYGLGYSWGGGTSCGNGVVPPGKMAPPAWMSCRSHTPPAPTAISTSAGRSRRTPAR